MKYVIEIDSSRPRLIDGRDVLGYLTSYGKATVALREATTADMGLHHIGCADCAFRREHAHGKTPIAGGAR